MAVLQNIYRKFCMLPGPAQTLSIDIIQKYPPKQESARKKEPKWRKSMANGSRQQHRTWYPKIEAETMKQNDQIFLSAQRPVRMQSLMQMARKPHKVYFLSCS
jgi:hypothetical protein